MIITSGFFSFQTTLQKKNVLSMIVTLINRIHRSVANVYCLTIEHIYTGPYLNTSTAQE